MNRNSPVYILGFTSALFAFFGLGVSAVHYATRDMLAANERLHHNRIVCEAFGLTVEGRAPGDYARAMARNLTAARTQDESGSRLVYRETDAADRVGFTFSGMGFWDRIEGFIVLTPDLASIVRLRFFSHKETPGLGARIEEPDFLRSFNGLPIDWDAPPERRVLIGPGPATGKDNRVDAVTGATQTSSALMIFLNRELARIRAIELDALAFKPVDGEREIQ